MGEHRHKDQRERVVGQVVDEMAKAATDKGLIIELGWIGMLRHVIPKDASETQVAEMRKAFFMGADHLFYSINSVMDSDREPTQQDFDRLTQIHNELLAFRMTISSHHKAPGRAQ